MKKENYLGVLCLKARPYYYSEYLQSELELQNETYCNDFFIEKSFNRLAVSMEVLNLKDYDVDFVPYPINLAVELRADDEVVSSKDFTVCLCPGVKFVQPQVNLEIDGMHLSAEIPYTVVVRRLGYGSPILAATQLRFYDKAPMEKIVKLISAHIERDGRRLRGLPSDEFVTDDKVVVTMENQGLPWDRVPEITGVHYNSQGDPSRIGATFETDSLEGNRFQVSFPMVIMPQDGECVYLEIQMLNQAFGGIVFSAKSEEEGEFSGQELEPITDYSPDKAMEILKQRGKLASKSAARQELENMVGLADVKRKLLEYEQLARFFVLRQRQGLPQHLPAMHSLFMGSPGTGKTTVAKLMGTLMREAGLLSKGHVVVKERSMLLTQFYGGGEQKTLEALEEARGGILFIDEAYQLHAPNDPKDPGKDIINTLMTALADDKNRDWMLIMAGYTQPMLKMMEMNPGLSSRFPTTNHYLFPDYGPEELEEIARRYFALNSYQLTPQAAAALSTLLRGDYEQRGKDFGNARHVMNIIQTSIIPAMASRVMALDKPSRDELSLIQVIDIPKSQTVANHSNSVPQRRRLGFAA